MDSLEFTGCTLKVTPHKCFQRSWAAKLSVERIKTETSKAEEQVHRVSKMQRKQDRVRQTIKNMGILFSIKTGERNSKDRNICSMVSKLFREEKACRYMPSTIC